MEDRNVQRQQKRASSQVMLVSLIQALFVVEIFVQNLGLVVLLTRMVDNLRVTDTKALISLFP